MSRFNFLSGVGIAALSGALAVSPAHASTGGEEAAAREASASVAEDTQNLLRERLAWVRSRPASDPVDASPVVDTTTTPFEIATVPDIAPAITVDSFAGFRIDEYQAINLDPIRFEGTQLDGGLVANVNDPEPRIIVRDDVGLDASVDVTNEWPSVAQLFFQNNETGGVFLNCTGTVINPRTILTAAHCVFDRSSEEYGVPGTAPSSILVSTGVDSSERLFNYLFSDVSYSEGGIATSTDVIIHPSSNPDTDGALPFPWADVALVAVDEPITDVPTLPVLLTPLDELTHVVAVGYGTIGTGLNGAQPSTNFLRRVGENMLGLIASQADLIDNVFPGFAPSFSTLGQNTQTLYFFDFDNPDRTAEQQESCVFNANGIQCSSLEAVLAIDYLDGDALDREVATAPGDSGSPLIVDELYDFPIVSGVLSGGYDFFGTNNRFADISFYNPLFPFFEFITENTSYKYVSAVEGDGVWSDPSRWTQELDPGFFIADGNGGLVNGIPDGEELGVYTTGPKLGTVLGNDVSNQPIDVAPGLPPFGTPGFGPNLFESSDLLGPGSTGFVPQNTDGTPGEAFANPAQYFEVILTRAGTTTVDLDVEIDRLVVDNSEAGFVLPDAWSFTSNIGVEQMAGFARIDGTLTTPIYTLGEAELAGEGTVAVDALFNVAGVLSANGTDAIGSFTIDGDYVQSSGGTLWTDVLLSRRGTPSADLLTVTGTAVLDGQLIVDADGSRARFGTEFAVLDADAIDGEFARTALISTSPVLTAESRVEGGEVIVRIEARNLRDIFNREDRLASLTEALDQLRRDQDSARFSLMFDLIDSATVDTLGATVASLAPSSAFAQSFTANGFAQRFTGQVAQRTLALRGGSRAVGAFSPAGNASFALAGGLPQDTGRVSVFGSASGAYRNVEANSGVLGTGSLGFTGQAAAPSANGISDVAIGANVVEQASLTQAGELTLGADMQVSDAFSFGLAISDIRNSQATTNTLRPGDNRSQAVAIYATYAHGSAFLDGYAGTARQEFGVERASLGNFRSAYDSASAQSDGQQVFGGLRMGYAFGLAEGIEMGPVASLDYVRSEIGGYEESGAGRFGLTIADRSFTSLGAMAGAMASVDVLTGENSALRAFGSVAYARELADSADIVTAHFMDAPDTAFTFANALDGEWVSVNAGAEYALGSNFHASLSVTSDLGRGMLSNDQGRVSLNWQF
ncbi:MAG: autotransporter domain-containing protein [Erythrobacter sp.]